MKEKYYVTFKTLNVGASTLMFHGASYSEMTWVCTEDKLEETLKSVADNKHQLVRIVKGVEVMFKHEIKVVPV